MPEPEYDFVPNFVCLTIRFKTPLTPYLSGSANETLNDGLNDGLNDRLKSTYGIIKANPGIQGKKIAELSGKSVPTIDRHIADLMQRGLIERRGSKKTGGYYAI